MAAQKQIRVVVKGSKRKSSTPQVEIDQRKWNGKGAHNN